MKLIICNGSPRGLQSNTKILTDSFIQGLHEAAVYDLKTYYLAKESGRKEGAKAFADADHMILAFPLYTDSMPGIVKEFLEMLEPYAGKEGIPSMSYIVQSGFPEPAQSRFVERYLQAFTSRMGAEYRGTVVKGGVEGIKIMPEWMTKKLLKNFFLLGREFGDTGHFNENILKKLAPREKLSRRRLLLFRLMQNTRMANFYWDDQLKKNGAFEQRFARPFATER